MLDFQPTEPNQRCDKCHMVLKYVRLTSEKDPYCRHCGYVLGTSVSPATWVCEDCGEIVLDTHPGNRPWCIDCKVKMSCLSAQPSQVHGAGTGDADLELGLAMLSDAQEADFETRLLRARKILRATAELKLGGDILRDSQSD